MRLFSRRIRKFTAEFFTIFISVIAAFSLTKWNENRRDRLSENKILSEIHNGLHQDLIDLQENITGHTEGIKAIRFFKNAILNKQEETDSLPYYFFVLTRDFVSVQNTSGYETLKSKGMDIIVNDSLRKDIISLYENGYKTLRKFEEEYSEAQFFQSYFKDFSSLLVPDFNINEKGTLLNLNLPLQLTEEEKKILITHLWCININREFILGFYMNLQKNIENLQHQIDLELRK